MALFKPTIGNTPIVVACLITIAIGLAILGFTLRQNPPGNAPAVVELPTRTPLPLPPSRDNSYVGTDACVACHGEIAGHWKSRPMGQSMCSIASGSIVESYDPDLRVRVSLDMTYKVGRNEDGAVHHEICTNIADGEVVYELPVEMHYAIGSGQQGRSYLRHIDGNILYQSPLTWYSSAQTWGQSPGFSRLRRHSRRIGDDCLQCHSGRMHAVDDRSTGHIFAEEAIGCERCHGPGKSHVDYYNALNSESEPNSTSRIVNPADLSPPLRDSVCFQCHLQSGTRVLRYGRDEWDFRPGDHLNDVWVVFIRDSQSDDKDGTTQAVSQAGQYIRSRCYQDSQGQLACTSCHDPHRSIAPAEQAAWYRGRCATCHHERTTTCAMPIVNREQTNDNSCIACHMPPLPANDVPHLAQTDHRILRDPASVGAPSIAIGDFQVFDGGGIDRLPELELRRAWALLKVLVARNESDLVTLAELLPEYRELVAIQPEDATLLTAWGKLLESLGMFNESRKALQRVLQIDPDHEAALRELALIAHETAEPLLALEYLERILKVNRWDSNVREQHIQTLIDLKRHDEATEAALRSLEIDPRSLLLHSWLADYFAEVGQADRSRHHARITRKLREIKDRYEPP